MYVDFFELAGETEIGFVLGDVLKCLYLARIGRSDIDFSFTQFYRSSNQQNQRCKRATGKPVGNSSMNRADGPKREPWRNPSAVVKPNMHNPIPIKHTNVIPTNIDHIPSNTTHSGPGAMFYVFEDNEVAIKMIIKGRSPTMRHVSRIHRIALVGCSTESIWIPKSKTKKNDTKHQLADILTVRNFTRDEWNKLLHLFHIHCSSLCCTKNSSLIRCPKSMAKKMQNKKEEERVVFKSRPAVMNISSFITTSSSTVSSPIASKSPGRLLRGNPTAR